MENLTVAVYPMDALVLAALNENETYGLRNILLSSLRSVYWYSLTVTIGGLTAWVTIATTSTSSTGIHWVKSILIGKLWVPTTIFI